MENLESRVTDLEIQISHQIRLVEELNSVIVLQQKQIEKMENLNNFLLQNLKSLNLLTDQTSSGYIAQIPPHY